MKNDPKIQDTKLESKGRVVYFPDQPARCPGCNRVVDPYPDTGVTPSRSKAQTPESGEGDVNVTPPLTPVSPKPDLCKPDLTEPEIKKPEFLTIKIHEPDEYCVYHSHEAEARVYVGLEGHGPICAEAAEELSGPLVLEKVDFEEVMK